MGSCGADTVYRPSLSIQARLTTSTVARAARLRLATPSINRPAAQMGMTRSAGPRLATPPCRVAMVVISVHTPISNSADTVGRPSRTKMMSAVKNTAMTMIPMTPGGRVDGAPAISGIEFRMVRLTSSKVASALKTGMSRIGNVRRTNSLRRWVSSGTSE